jgi:hypothetical protein
MSMIVEVLSHCTLLYLMNAKDLISSWICYVETHADDPQ